MSRRASKKVAGESKSSPKKSSKKTKPAPKKPHETHQRPKKAKKAVEHKAERKRERKKNAAKESKKKPESKADGASAPAKPRKAYVRVKKKLFLPREPSIVADPNRAHRPAMEDVFVVESWKDGDGHQWQGYAVFDGHGGGSVSSWLGKHFLLQYIAPALHGKKPHAHKEIEQTLVNAFHRADEALHKVQPAQDDAGSTCAMFLRSVQHCYLASVGDSRVVVFDDSGAILRETEDQRPIVPAERARVEAAGGRITDDGGEPRVMDDVAMTRAFGDFSLKRKFDRHGKGGSFTTTDGVLVSTPQVLYVKLVPGRSVWMVSASDGLWDGMQAQVLSSEKVAHFVSRFDESKGGDVCDALRKTAIAKDCRDNLTVVIVKLL